MIDFLTNHNLMGLTIGLITFLIIGLFHPLVVKAEYYLGVKSWWLFFISGIIGVALSITTENTFLAIIYGVVAFSCFWSILEVIEQEKRVEKGWFPANPNKKKKTEK